MPVKQFFLYLFLILLVTLQEACKPSAEELKKQEQEHLSNYIQDLRKIHARTKSFLDLLESKATMLHLPSGTELKMDGVPDPAFDFEMKNSNIVWYQVQPETYTMSGAPDFKLVDILPASRSTAGVNLINGYWDKLQRDSTLLLKESASHEDSTGLGWFASCLNLKESPYAIFFRELKREDTDIAEKDWLSYTFEGGGIIVAVWIMDLRNGKLLGSYVRRVVAEKAWRISDFKDTTSNDRKNQEMKRTIYMASCQQLVKDVKEDIQTALNQSGK